MNIRDLVRKLEYHSQHVSGDQLKKLLIDSKEALINNQQKIDNLERDVKFYKTKSFF